MKKILLLFCFFLSSLAFADNDNDSLIRTRIVFDVPQNVDVKQLELNLKDALNDYSDKLNDYKGFMPDDLPAEPSEAQKWQTASEINYDDALYALRGYYLFRMFGNSDAQVFIATIYPHINGYRVYLYTYFRASYNFLGMLASFTKDQVGGTGLNAGFERTIKIRDSFMIHQKNAKLYRQSPEIMAQFSSVYTDGIGSVYKLDPIQHLEFMPIIESAPITESTIIKQNASGVITSK